MLLNKSDFRNNIINISEFSKPSNKKVNTHLLFVKNIKDSKRIIEEEIEKLQKELEVIEKNAKENLEILESFENKYFEVSYLFNSDLPSINIINTTVSEKELNMIINYKDYLENDEVLLIDIKRMEDKFSYTNKEISIEFPEYFALNIRKNQKIVNSQNEFIEKILKS